MFIEIAVLDDAVSDSPTAAAEIAAALGAHLGVHVDAEDVQLIYRDPRSVTEDLSPEDLLRHLQWVTADNNRLTRYLTDYRDTVLGAVDTIRNAS